MLGQHLISFFFEKQFDKKIDDRAGMWHEKWWSSYQKSIKKCNKPKSATQKFK